MSIGFEDYYDLILDNDSSYFEDILMELYSNGLFNFFNRTINKINSSAIKNSTNQALFVANTLLSTWKVLPYNFQCDSVTYPIEFTFIKNLIKTINLNKMNEFTSEWPSKIFLHQFSNNFDELNDMTIGKINFFMKIKYKLDHTIDSSKIDSGSNASNIFIKPDISKRKTDIFLELIDLKIKQEKYRQNMLSVDKFHEITLNFLTIFNNEQNYKILTKIINNTCIYVNINQIYTFEYKLFQCQILWNSNEKDQAIMQLKSLINKMKEDLQPFEFSKICSKFYSILGSWIGKLRLQKSSDILHEYFEKSIQNSQVDVSDLLKIYERFAKFAFKAYISYNNQLKAESVVKKKQFLKTSMEEIKVLNRQNNQYKKYLDNLEKFCSEDCSDINQIEQQRISFILTFIKTTFAYFKIKVNII